MKTGWIDSAEYLGVTPNEMEKNGFTLIGRGRSKIPSDEIVYAWSGKQQFFKRSNSVKYYIGRWYKKFIDTQFSPEETERLSEVLKTA